MVGFAPSDVLPEDRSDAFLCLLFTADGITNLKERVPEEMSTAAEGVLGHVHAEVLGRDMPVFIPRLSLTPLVVLFASPSG